MGLTIQPSNTENSANHLQLFVMQSQPFQAKTKYIGHDGKRVTFKYPSWFMVRLAETVRKYLATSGNLFITSKERNILFNELLELCLSKKSMLDRNALDIKNNGNERPRG